MSREAATMLISISLIKPRTCIRLLPAEPCTMRKGHIPAPSPLNLNTVCRCGAVVDWAHLECRAVGHDAMIQVQKIPAFYHSWPRDHLTRKILATSPHKADHPRPESMLLRHSFRMW